MDKQIRSPGIGPNKSNNTNMTIVDSKATPWICYIKNQFNYTTWLSVRAFAMKGMLNLITMNKNSFSSQAYWYSIISSKDDRILMFKDVITTNK